MRQLLSWLELPQVRDRGSLAVFVFLEFWKE